MAEGEPLRSRAAFRVRAELLWDCWGPQVLLLVSVVSPGHTGRRSLRKGPRSLPCSPRGSGTPVRPAVLGRSLAQPGAHPAPLPSRFLTSGYSRCFFLPCVSPRSAEGPEPVG